MASATHVRVAAKRRGDSCSRRVRRPVALVGYAVLLCFVTAGCLREPKPLPPPPPPATPTPSLVVEDVPAEETIRLEIIDLQPRRTEDHGRVTAQGVLINRGTKATSELTIIVSAVDADGKTLISVNGIPEADRIPAGGGTVRFSAVMDYLPEAVEYRVEAIAR